MMTLEELRQKIQSQYIEVEAAGVTWRLGKITGPAYLAMAGRELSPEDRVLHYLSVSLGGEYDSDEGRALLKQLDAESYLALSNAAVEFNASKKK